METENSQNMFLVSIIYNSKMRELSDGNIIIVCQTTFLLWIPPFLSYKLWKQRIELPKKAIQMALVILRDLKLLKFPWKIILILLYLVGFYLLVYCL